MRPFWEAWAERLQPKEAADGPAVEMVVYKSVAEFNRDAGKRLRGGWRMEGQSQDKDRVATGRKLGTAAAAGIAAFPIAPLAAVGSLLIPQRKRGKITVTWVRDPQAD